MRGTESSPWLGNFYEFEVRSCARYLGFSQLSTGGHRLRSYSSNSCFLQLSLCNALPDPVCSLEIEAVQATTPKQHGELDQLKLSLRNGWLDDIAGDNLSMATGLSYTQAFRRSLDDLSSFHHGLYNAELFVSLGKEFCQGIDWGQRLWGTAAFGVAEIGSPWLSLKIDYDKRFWESSAVTLFAKGLIGLGSHKLRPEAFHGYGKVAHRSLDLGCKYTYEIPYYGSASIEYAFRPYARNFPIYSHQVLLSVFYRFGL